jgi:ADP-ribosylglycohydrolase
VAVAAASFASARGAGLDRARLFETVLDHVPAGDVRAGIERAWSMDPGEDPLRVAKALGADRDILCQVTVPFTLWMATRAPDDFAGTLFATYAVGGDRDTHGAIVGGLLCARLGRGAIPDAWRDATEPLPSWL